jgi:hypothetical protein
MDSDGGGMVPNVEIRCANPIDHETAIKNLFTSNERPEFPEFFDRAYPSAVREGARSWIGLDSTGEIVLHMARFPRRFSLGDRTLVGGLLVNLMAAKSHRKTFPVLALLRRVIADSAADDSLDFLYGDPNPQAHSVLQIVGLTGIGSLERFAFPVAGGPWPADLGLRAYHWLRASTARRDSLTAMEHPADRFDLAPFVRPLGESSALRPFRPPEAFQQRLPGYPSAADRWFTFHRGGSATPAVAALLVRRIEDRVAHIVSITSEPSIPPTALIPPLTRALRDAGFERAWLWTTVDSSLGRELKRAGFIPRNNTNPLLGKALTPAGEEVVRCSQKWEITDLDCDR